MNKLLIILFLLLLTSCEYDYIHNDPNHPDEYRGIWKCDSIYVDNKLSSKEPKANFLQLIQPVMEFDGIGYANWKVRKDTIPNVLIGLNTPNIPAITLNVVKAPIFDKDGIKLELKLENKMYYLTNTMR
jgi:hypothetical protein